MQNLDIEVAIELGGCCLRTIDDFTGDFLRILEIDCVRGWHEQRHGCIPHYQAKGKRERRETRLVVMT